MKIGGLQKLTLIDFPGRVAATVFLIGCNFRCPYCYNSELVDSGKIENHPQINEKDVFDFLKERKGFLEAVCITGGEPTIYENLPEFIKKIKKLEFLVKLDTNGSNPSMLLDLINEELVDFVAMDIKNSLENYQKTIGRKINFKNIQRSIRLLKKNFVPYEFRTTVVPKLVNENDIREIGMWIKGAEKFALQQFRPEKPLDDSFQKVRPYSEETLDRFVKILKLYVKEVELRV